jgi:hypothetical protein
MPHIMIADAFGYQYDLHSSNPETIAAWLAEIFRKLSSVNNQVMAARVNVMPLPLDYVNGKATYDWPPGESAVDSRIYDQDAMEELATLLGSPHEAYLALTSLECSSGPDTAPYDPELGSEPASKRS